MVEEGKVVREGEGVTRFLNRWMWYKEMAGEDKRVMVVGVGTKGEIGLRERSRSCGRTASRNGLM